MMNLGKAIRAMYGDMEDYKQVDILGSCLVLDGRSSRPWD